MVWGNLLRVKAYLASSISLFFHTRWGGPITACEFNNRATRYPLNILFIGGAGDLSLRLNAGGYSKCRAT